LSHIAVAAVVAVAAAVETAFAVEFEQSEVEVNSFVAVAASAVDSAVVAGKSVVLEFEPFAALGPGTFVDLELEQLLEPGPACVAKSDTAAAVEHKSAAAGCKSVVVECNLDCQKWFEVDELRQL
jgi:hypothetical protein